MGSRRPGIAASINTTAYGVVTHKAFRFVATKEGQVLIYAGREQGACTAS